MLKIFNTLGRQLEEFKPLYEGKVSFYHCGPTVYWTQHIGNMRGMAMGDLIRRSLTYLGYEVMYVRNYTDFGHLTSDADEGEDKMEKGAKREGRSPQEIADKYIKEFEKDTETLNILSPTVKARATDYIQDMINLVKTLLDKGFAYSTPKAIYFDISKYPEYTAMSGRDLDKDIRGAGFGSVEDEHKKHPADFALWFFRTGVHKNALQYWPSPFSSAEVEKGEGIPGWHIECSAMAMTNLGPTIDLHMGGVEHVSIHHPNEIAQSECANGVKYVNYWLHNEHLTANGEKMSKSLGNIWSLDEIIVKGYDPMDLRYFFLQAHYRSKQNFTFEALDGAKSAREKIVSKLKNYKKDNLQVNLNKVLDSEYKDKFIKALEDDFNIAQALAVLWDVVNSDLDDLEKFRLVLDFDKVFGLKLEESMNNTNDTKQELSQEVQDLLDQRKRAREDKDWAKSDQIRDRLKNEFGILVEDTQQGQDIKHGA